MKALFFFFLFLFCTDFAIAQADFLGYRRGEWVALEIDSSLGDYLNNLTPDERPEQMRDWVILAIIQRLNQDDVVKSAFDIAPLRYDFQQDLEQFRFGETRWLPLKNGELIVLRNL